MRQLLLAVSIALTLAPLVSAHEGHDQKIMGTVSTITATRLDMKTTAGKMASITLTTKTKVIHGAMAMKIDDLEVGDRVVVTASAEGKGPLIAKEVRLGAAAVKSKKK